MSLMISSHYTEIAPPQQGKLTGALDAGVLLLATLLVCAGSYLFLFPPFRQPQLRGLTEIARIDSLSESSQRKISGTLGWIDARSADRLFEGDQILTTEVSSVEVSFDDGPKLSIGPQSLVRIRRGADGYSVELVKGALSLKAGDGLEVIDGNSGERLKLQAGGDLVTSAQGLQRVDPSKSFFRQGNLIDPMRHQTLDLAELPAGVRQAVVVDGSGRELSATALDRGPASLSTPAPGRYSLLLKDSAGRVVSTAAFRVLPYTAPTLAAISSAKTYTRGESLPLRWGGPAGITYRVRVDGPQGGESFLTKSPEFAYPLKSSGTHRFQVSVAEGAQELRGEEAVAAITLVDGLMFPVEQLHQTVSVSEAAQFDVQNNHRKEPMLFEVSRAADFASITKTVESEQLKNAIVMTAPGVYYVRARTLGQPPLYSKPAKLVVKTPVAKVAKNYPAQQPIQKNSKKAKLSWTNEAGVGRVKLQLAKDPGFSEVFHELETTKTSAEVLVPALGTYYWRVLPTEEAPEFITSSKVASLEVTLPPPLRVPQIIPQQIIHYEESDGVPSHKIQIFPYENAQRYHLEVFADAAAKNLVFRESSRVPVVNWMSSRTGKYFYRVRVEDIWGRTSQYSPIGELIFPISPLVEL